MADGTAESADAHWFAGKDADVLIYRVNRRPFGGQPMLDFEERPTNVLTHLRSVLTDLDPVRTGTSHQRFWRLGDKEFNEASGTFTARLGWSRETEGVQSYFDEERQSWIDRAVRQDDSAVSPIAFVKGDGEHDARFLGVLRHPGFDERTIARVLTELLNRGEGTGRLPSVEWAVEPVGDPREFQSWVEAADLVSELRFVFERPNPDGEEAFQELFERLDHLEAERIAERIHARDPDTGLNKAALFSDKNTLGFIAAAMAAFGYVVGKGRRDGKVTRYDQRQEALRQRVENVSPEWQAASQDVLEAVRRAVRRREQDGQG